MTSAITAIDLPALNPEGEEEEEEEEGRTGGGLDGIMLNVDFVEPFS